MSGGLNTKPLRCRGSWYVPVLCLDFVSFLCLLSLSRVAELLSQATGEELGEGKLNDAQMT